MCDGSQETAVTRIKYTFLKYVINSFLIQVYLTKKFKIVEKKRMGM